MPKLSILADCVRGNNVSMTVKVKDLTGKDLIVSGIFVRDRGKPALLSDGKYFGPETEIIGFRLSSRVVIV